MPASARSSPANQALHSECPTLPWAGSSSRHLQHQEVKALMHESKERFMEILLAETAVEVAEITATLDASPPRPGSARLHYRMAVVSARLDVLLHNRYILAGAQAFEKLTELRRQVDQLIQTYWSKLDPVKVANDKWTELRTWMLSVEALEDQLHTHQKCIAASGGRTPGKSALSVTLSAIQTLLRNLRPRILTLLDNMPADAVADGRLLPELADYAILQQLLNKTDEDIVLRFEQLHQLLSQPGALAAHPLIQSAEKTLAEVQALIELHAQHARALQESQIEFQCGNIDKARNLLVPLKNIHFSDLDYETLRKGISRAIRLMGHLKTGRRAEAITNARTLLTRYPGIRADSQIYREATAVIHQRGLPRIVRYACAAIVLLAGIVALSLYLMKKKADLSDTAQETSAIQATVDHPSPPIEVSTTIGEQDDPATN